MIYITSDNIAQYAKIQSTKTHVGRDEVRVMWDELSKKQRKLAENIDIDLKVVTSEPHKVPEKWSDSIIEEEGEVSDIDIIKQLTANPSRIQCFNLLIDNSPNEAKLMWWIPNIFNDSDFFITFSEACYEGLFQTSSDYIFGALAFGSSTETAKFYWPESDKDDPEVKSVKKKLVEKGMDRKEVDKAWNHIKDYVNEMVELTDEEADYLGVVPLRVEEEEEEEVEEEESEPESSSLLDY